MADVGDARGRRPAIDRLLLLVQRARFGSPLESGYALATVPPWLEAQRQLGLFSIAHVAMNLDYLFIHLPMPKSSTSLSRSCKSGRPRHVDPAHEPGAPLRGQAPWGESRSWWLARSGALVLIPTLLYYGGGWLQYGYRYALDSIPFIWALCGLAAARDERVLASVGVTGPAIGAGWRWLIVIGVVVGLGGVYWAYNL